MTLKRSALVFSLGLTLTLVVGSGALAGDDAVPKTSTIPMVCKHGAVKSLIAASLFNQGAQERGLPYRAISRGITPYEEVPAGIARALEKDGFAVADFKPQKLLNPEVASSSRVIAIGVDLSVYQGEATSPILEWNDIPPASVDYEASKAALMAHIQELLDELEELAPILDSPSHGS